MGWSGGVQNPLKTVKQDVRDMATMASWARQSVRLGASKLGQTITKAIDPRRHNARSVALASFGNQANHPPPDLKTLQEEEVHEPVIWRGIEIPAEDAASVPLVMREGTPQDPGPPVTDHEAWEPLRRINPADDPSSFWLQTFKDLRGAGDSFWFQYLQGGKPHSFERLLPPDVVPEPHPRKIIGSYTWRTSDAMGRLGQLGTVELGIPVDNMFHLRNGSNPRTNLRGMGALERLRYYIGMSQTMQDWNWNRYARGIPTEYIVFFKGTLNDGERENIEDQLRRKFQGPDGDPWMLVDADANGEQPFSVHAFPRPTEDELAFLDSDQRILYRIALAMGVPPAKYQDFSQSTRIANADAMMRLYWTDTIKNGLHARALGYLNSTWFPRYWPGESFFFEYDYKNVAELQQSAAELGQIMVGYIGAGVYTRNQVREKLGEEPGHQLDKDGQNVMDLYTGPTGKPLGQDSLMPLDLFGLGGSAPRRDPKEDPEAGEEADPTPEELEAEEALAAAGKVIKLRGALASRKMIPRDILDLEAERKAFADMIRTKLERMVQLAGEQQLEIAGISGVFNMADQEVLAFLKDQLVALEEAVVLHTNEVVRAAVAESLQTGEPIAQMRSRIQGAFEVRREPYQLDRISRTEVHTAQEGGSLLSAKQNGVDMKRWITARDSRVRGLELGDQADHDAIEASGPIPVSAAFVDPVSGAQMMFPGDRRGAVRGADTINCRCTWVPDFSHLDDKAAKSVDADEAWYTKAATRDGFELDLRRTVKRYLLAMERRALQAFDAQARETLEGKAHATG